VRGLPDVVVIEVRDAVPARLGERAVARRAGVAGARGQAHEPDAAVGIAGDDRIGVVRARVGDDDQLPVALGLGEHAVDRGPDRR
jgi:hypothetical protein